MTRIESIFDDLPVAVMDNPVHHANTSDFGPPLATHAMEFTPPQKTVAEHPRNPWAWWTISDLFALCGPLLTVFLVLQVASATVLTQCILRFIECDRHLLNGALILAALLTDWLVLHFQRGKHYERIFRPLFGIGTITILPGVIAMVWLKILTLS